MVNDRNRAAFAQTVKIASTAAAGSSELFLVISGFQITGSFFEIGD
jgi:hypothetical protein